MALFHTTVVDNQIKALDTIGSVSGAIATFETDKAERLVNLEVAIVATGGGGTPTTPISINGFSACNLSVNGTTETIPFGQTIYCGSLNVGSGVLTITHGYKDLGTLTWSSISLDRWVSNNITNIKSVSSSTTVANIKAEKYPTCSHNDLANNNQVGIDCLYSDLYVRNSPTTDTPTGLCIFELANPTVIQLDSKQIQASIGTNNIYCDTGDIIDLKFVLSVGKAIS